jgi:proteic killer suppression protein
MGVLIILPTRRTIKVGVLRFIFKFKKLQALYTDEAGAHKFPSEVVEAFFEAMAILANAKDERDLYGFKGLRYEKLKGPRKDERSIRLNKQYRLTLKPQADKGDKLLLILDVEKHYE